MYQKTGREPGLHLEQKEPPSPKHPECSRPHPLGCGVLLFLVLVDWLAVFLLRNTTTLVSLN